MFALVDGNSFYASCEQVFRPDLRGKPILVIEGTRITPSIESPEAKIEEHELETQVQNSLERLVGEIQI